MNNFDVSENRIGRGGTMASGEFGDMPQSLLNKKYEQTRIYEDPYETETYFRQMLTYTGPDPTSFEEEEARRNTFSEDKLKLRYHGGRSEFEPRHPEAFFEMTEHDPRGTTTDPDMRKAYDQHRYRGKYIMFYNDAVPEAYRSESRVIRDIRSGFNAIKSRFKIFDTSKESFANAGVQTMKGQQQKYFAEDTKRDGINVDGRSIHRGDKTIVLSNYYPMGWYNTTDHDFRVAQYGKMNSSKKMGEVDYRYVQDNTENDVTMYSFKDNTIPLSMIHTMQRLATELTDKPSANFEMSVEGKLNLYSQGMRAKRLPDGAQEQTQKRVTSMVNTANNRGKLYAENKSRKDDTSETASKPRGWETKTNHYLKSEVISRRLERGLRNGDVDIKSREFRTYNYKSAPIQQLNNNMGDVDLTSRNGNPESSTSQDRPTYESRRGRKRELSKYHETEGDHESKEFESRSSNGLGRMEDKGLTKELTMQDKLPNSDF